MNVENWCPYSIWKKMKESLLTCTFVYLIVMVIIHLRLLRYREWTYTVLVNHWCKVNDIDSPFKIFTYKCTMCPLSAGSNYMHCSLKGKWNWLPFIDSDIHVPFIVGLTNLLWCTIYTLIDNSERVIVMDYISLSNLVLSVENVQKKE